MTRSLTGEELARNLEEALPGSVERQEAKEVWVQPDRLLDVASYMHASPDLNFDFLAAVTGVDYVDCFEIVYHLVSLRFNHRAVLKVRLYDRNYPVVPSLVSIWRGADLQEREIYDLMGIRFKNHPNLKRVLLWEGFDGHPLRKDYL